MRSFGYIQIMGGPGVGGFVDPGMASLQACLEADTYTCGHCQHIVIMAPGRKDDGLCFKCNRLVCKHCVKAGNCAPFEEEIERKLAPRGF